MDVINGVAGKTKLEEGGEQMKYEIKPCVCIIDKTGNMRFWELAYDFEYKGQKYASLHFCTPASDYVGDDG